MARPPSPRPRLPDWPERLAALVEARREAPFAWGRHDCGLFAADAVAACTGEDPAADLRAHRTEAEAEALIAAHGSLLGLMRFVHGRRGAAEIPPALAQRGDTVLAELGNEVLIGVALGEVIAAPGPDGLVFAPIGAARLAWVT